MFTSSINEYIEKKEARRNVPSKFINGEMLYFHDGTWINQSLFNKLYPVCFYVPNVNTFDNPDKTKII